MDSKEWWEENRDCVVALDWQGFRPPKDFEGFLTLEELYQNIEARIMQSDKVYQHFAERFRKEHQAVKMVPSESVPGALDCVARMDIAWVKDTTT